MQQKINGHAAPQGAIVGGAIPAKLVVDNQQEPLGPIGTAPTPARTVAVSHEDLVAELARLKAENERLKANHGPKLNYKVSEKGAVSVYGLGRFPVTLFQSQMRRLLGAKEEIEKFMDDNTDKLASKE